MEELRISRAGPGMGEQWDEFVTAKTPDSLCHRFVWRSVIESTYKLRCEYLFAERSGNLVGILPLVAVKELLSGQRLVSMPFLDQGGILAEDLTVVEELFSAARDLGSSLGARGIDLRGGRFPEGAANGDISNRYRFLLALPDGAEELWSVIGGKVRNQVRKSDKSGLITEQEDLGALGEFYEIFAENMKDLGSPVHARRLFDEIFRSFGESARLYLTRDSRGRAVGGGVAIRSGATVTVPWASSRRSERASCPNHSLYWRVLRDALEGGAQTFDFGRSTEGTGTFHFKKQWNAKPVPLRWSSFHCDGRLQEVENLDPRRNKRLARAWSRLPLRAANFVGPRVRKYLSN